MLADRLSTSRSSVVLALTAAMLLAACGRGTHTAPAAASFNTSDVRFLQDMISYHHQAIEIATLVDGNSRRVELITFAAQITAKRQAEISTMGQWLTRWDQPTPQANAMEDVTSLVPGMLDKGQLDWLKLRQGNQFDLGFLTMMNTHHGGAAELAEMELPAGESADVKALARRILTTLQAEMGQIHDWKDAWSDSRHGTSR
jgi:uncharacterized protein (DUF305 family)